MRTAKQNSRPVVFGEVLFDCFPDGRDVLGGAPFNVAWHLKGFGLDPLFISRVGTDSLGDAVLAAMADWGMDCSAVRRDPHAPTGRVVIEMDGASHRFDILADQAYDQITPEDIDAISGVSAGPIYAGSLITRGANAHSALRHLLARFVAPLFLDINLRPPWWQRERVLELMRAATWAKLNDEEVIEVAGGQDLMETATQLPEQFALDLLVLTRGADGACLLDRRETECRPTPAVDEIVDTVGAGDAFSAVTLYGLIHGWPKKIMLARALAFAAEICQQRGATANDPALYTRFREQWENGAD